jgi:hypothetical protein
MHNISDKSILAITLLAFLCAIVLTVYFLTYAPKPAAPEEMAVLPTASEMPTPELPRVSAPSAILVLDVSGSMGLTGRPSDPDRLQTVATLRFFDTYLKISQEILAEDDEAGIAVVLFGTVAQTIDWEDGALFLPVTEQNRSHFQDVIEHYLGAPRGRPGDNLPDPRRSQDSDYAAALVAVEELVDGLTTPPAVLFMTDGMMVIHPCFTPLLDEDARSGLRGCRDGIVAPPRLSATDLSAIFNRRDGERPINKVDVPANVDPEAEFLQRMQRLMARRFPDPAGGSGGLEQQAPLAWFPMHLDIRGRHHDQREVGRLLDSDDTSRLYWDLPEGMIHCPTADEMVHQFVTALVRWLRLFERPLAPDETRFQLPNGARTLVVQVESEQPVQAVRLVQNSRSIDLAGQGRFWSGVVTGDCTGQWVLTTAGTIGVNVTVFYSLGHDWALTAPAICAEDAEGRNPEAHLSLCRKDDQVPVAATDMFGNLPAVLPGAIHPSGAPPLALEFHRVAADGASRGQAYMAEIPVAEIREGQARITIELGALHEIGVPVQRQELSRTVTIESRTYIVIQDHQDRRTDRIQLENVPRAPDWARALREKMP